ncbi:response regulator [Thalassotalea euphylliae]|uniref:Response regulator n=1 Tax=Thalassotalea euphylliae TaxID=1655234 RepID=A0A3E0TVR6_9GAMM|nr:response regulator [Thalassotalea euphylliae]REL28544.1 response regulator [Thalassotalea euphylliae]
MTKHILIIDDDIELSELLSSYLSAEGFTITCRHDGASGLAKAFDQDIDLILLDVMMPKLNGFDVLKALGGKHSIPILMLTAKGDDSDRILGLELGADDYLPKPFHHQELLARIKAIFRRIDITKQHTGNSSLLNINDVVIDNATRQVKCADHLLELTGTEFEILFELMSQHSVIVSKEQLSQHVLGRKLSPFDRSIDMHVSNIRRKISQYASDDKIKTVRGAGYIFLAGDKLD